MSERALERRIVTVLFCDVVGFTSLSEALDAEDVVAVQDAYFDAVRETVARHGGCSRSSSATRRSRSSASRASATTTPSAPFELGLRSRRPSTSSARGSGSTRATCGSASA